MALIDPKTATRVIALGQSIRDEYRVKSSLVYDRARTPVAPVVISKPLSRNKRRIIAKRMGA